MSDHPADFRVEIIPCRPQGLETAELGAVPAAVPVDITSLVGREGFGSINRALERDLLSFKTGDLTLTARNRDGFFDDLFAFFGPTDIWSLRVYRRGEVQFWGVLIGKGSITFNRKGKECEITIYGLTKILDMTTAEDVKRTFSTMTLGAGAVAGATTITLNTTTSILSGDTLHITDHVNKEDVTVRQVLSSTQVLLESGIVAGAGYASGSEVTCPTPFHRYKSIPTLVNLLFERAGVPVARLLISGSQFNLLGPTPVNQSGLATIAAGNPIYTNPAERNSRRYDTHLVDGTYYQEDPEDDWTLEDATVRAWVDWSRYYRQDEAEPTLFLRDPDTAETTPAGGNVVDPHRCAYEYKNAIPLKWNVNGSSGDINQRANTVADGITWTARATIATIPGARWNASSTQNEIGCEVDIVRRDLYIWSNEGGGGAGSPALELYDINSGTLVGSLRQSDDTAGYCYGGFKYVPELDAVVGLRSSNKNGPDFEIVAFRDGARIWKRPFPNCLVQTIAGVSHTVWPTHNLRYVSGKLYCIVVSDGKAQLVYSDDEFQTYTMKALTDPGVGPRQFAARVNDAYQIACYKTVGASSLQAGLFIAAPFYAGVVEYADFEGDSCAEALKKLSVIANAVFYVDDDLQGHFIARDLYDPGAVSEVGDRVMEQTDDLLWDETAQYVTVSGNSFEATSGDAGFGTEGIDLESEFIPTEAFAQALADAVFAFYSAQRRMVEAPVIDTDGRIYRPLDRVTLGGPERYLVYESDHSLVDDEVSLTLLEDR